MLPPKENQPIAVLLPPAAARAARAASGWKAATPIPDTATGVSERTLSRLFRSEFGVTFPQWRTQSRLHHALRMLADDAPVTRVAHHCGWSSTSAFIDVFRRSFGYTPGTHNRRA